MYYGSATVETTLLAMLSIFIDSVERLGKPLAFLVILMCFGSIAAAGENPGRKESEPCLRCHALPQSGSAFIRGQPRAYLIAQMQAYRDGRRKDWAMAQALGTLNDNQIKEIAGYISGLKLGPSDLVDATRVEAGRRELRKLDCQSCHGSGYKGAGKAPRLAGQNPRYTAWEISLIRSGGRHHPAGKPQTELKAISGETINAVANALGSFQ